MPEADKEGERYSADMPQTSPGFFLKGSHQLDWGMKNRLARTFNPDSGRTVMLAIDHGYFQGPTTGLERIDLSILPLLPSCDALFCTRGILRSMVPAQSQKPMVLRASGGPSILREELSDEQIAMDMDDAVRLNAAGVGIQVFIGGEHETRSVHNMTRLVDAGHARRHAGDGHHRGRQDHGARRQIFPPRLPHHRRARRAIREDLLRRARISRPSPPPARCRS